MKRVCASYMNTSVSVHCTRVEQTGSIKPEVMNNVHQLQQTAVAQHGARSRQRRRAKDARAVAGGRAAAAKWPAARAVRVVEAELPAEGARACT